MYFTLLVVVILTAIALVAVALGIARAISPRSYNPQKGEAYECGIPTRWITTSFRWAKSGFDRFDCSHAHLPTEEAHHSCLTEFARKNNSLQYMYFVLLMVVILTAIGLVAIALGVARAISPRSYNPQKGEAYECGIPTRGKSWMQFKVGYYLFAILFLMFDVETVFLFAWAVVVQEIGVFGLVSALFFLLILTFGLAYAWRKGALEWK